MRLERFSNIGDRYISNVYVRVCSWFPSNQFLPEFFLFPDLRKVFMWFRSLLVETFDFRYNMQPDLKSGDLQGRWLNTGQVVAYRIPLCRLAISHHRSSTMPAWFAKFLHAYIIYVSYIQRIIWWFAMSRILPFFFLDVNTKVTRRNLQ